MIANLEDIVTEFRKRWDLFLKMYEDFMADRDTYDGFLSSFENDKKILRQIPVISILLEPMDGSKVSETTTSTSETEPSKEISLYDWISSSDSKNSLDDLYEICTSNLKKVNTFFFVLEISCLIVLFSVREGDHAVARKTNQ